MDISAADDAIGLEKPSANDSFFLTVLAEAGGLFGLYGSEMMVMMMMMMMMMMMVMMMMMMWSLMSSDVGWTC